MINGKGANAVTSCRVHSAQLVCHRPTECLSNMEQLPEDVRSSTSLQLFQRRLKSELFRRSLGPRHSAWLHLAVMWLCSLATLRHVNRNVFITSISNLVLLFTSTSDDDWRHCWSSWQTSSPNDDVWLTDVVELDNITHSPTVQTHWIIPRHTGSYLTTPIDHTPHNADSWAAGQASCRLYKLMFTNASVLWTHCWPLCETSRSIIIKPASVNWLTQVHLQCRKPFKCRCIYLPSMQQ